MKYFVFFLLFYSHASIAQQIIEGNVIDSNQLPLHYVSVGIIGTSDGTVTDQKGYFRFSFQVCNSSDSIRFSMVGYESKTFSLNEFLSTYLHAPVCLQRAQIELKEVIVQYDRLKRKTIGNKNTDANLKVNFSIPGQPGKNLGSEIGEKFHISKPTRIEQVKFYLSSNDYDTAIFRINIYSVNRGLPLQSLLSKNIVKQVFNKGRNWIEVDLQNEEITVDEDVIVSLEWIAGSSDGTVLSIPITWPSIGAIHYYKFGSQNHWKKFLNMASCIDLQIAN